MAPIKVILLGDCKLLPFSISQWNQRVKQIMIRIRFDIGGLHKARTKRWGTLFNENGNRIRGKNKKHEVEIILAKE
ncbi:hypothetical protein [Gimesia maris]|uniref:Uncharacterized protein n=1 Tax=Gimesia maris TaxID=122 RepID=A0ABX5YIX7_9PLAN|nr:hypothetical protein [Gimesia maris]QEG15565.1 hypothetical protein GmarT_14060 [Gimesia maris]QGQ31138.1 hypothetical protein F1729_22265 [Gimesia maris]